MCHFFLTLIPRRFQGHAVVTADEPPIISSVDISILMFLFFCCQGLRAGAVEVFHRSDFERFVIFQLTEKIISFVLLPNVLVILD